MLMHKNGSSCNVDQDQVEIMTKAGWGIKPEAKKPEAKKVEKKEEKKEEVKPPTKKIPVKGTSEKAILGKEG